MTILETLRMLIKIICLPSKSDTSILNILTYNNCSIICIIYIYILVLGSKFIWFILIKKVLKTYY